MEKHNDILHKIAYNIDASHLESNEETEVFLPKNEEEIHKILEIAIEKNKKIILRWAGTNLVGNCLPDKDCFIIDMSGLNKIIAHNKDTITVQPWVVLDNLNNHLQEHWKCFPVNIWSHLVAQIWAMIATNAAGMKAIKYGKMEDRVNFLEVMYVDKNKQIRTEKLQWQDVKDFVNSEWILWVIIKAELKIIDKPYQKSISFLPFDSLQELIEKVEEYKEQEQTAAIEYIDKIVAWFLSLEKKYHLFVEFEDDNMWDINDHEKIKDVWSIRDSCYSVIVSNGYDWIEDPQIDLKNAEEILLWFEKNEIPVFGHIWTGILHPHFKKDQEQLIKQMYQKVENMKWNVSGEHWIWLKKKEFISNEERKKIEKLKEKYDPNKIFGWQNIL